MHGAFFSFMYFMHVAVWAGLDIVGTRMPEFGKRSDATRTDALLRKPGSLEMCPSRYT
jgi:hypothetical protein